MAAGGEQTRSAHARDVSLGARIKKKNLFKSTCQAGIVLLAPGSRAVGNGEPCKL